MDCFVVQLSGSKRRSSDNVKSLQISRMVSPLGWTETIECMR